MINKILALYDEFKDNSDIISITFDRYHNQGPEPRVFMQHRAFFNMLDPQKSLKENGVWLQHAEHCDTVFLWYKKNGVLFETCFSPVTLTMQDLEVIRNEY